MSQDTVIEDDATTTQCGKGYSITSIVKHNDKRYSYLHNRNCMQHDNEYNYNLTKLDEPACYGCNKKLDEYSFYIYSQDKEDYRRDIYYVTCSHTCPGIISNKQNAYFTSACIKCKCMYIYMRYDNRICPDCKYNEKLISYKKTIMPELIAYYGTNIPVELFPDIIKYYTHLNIFNF